MATISTNQIARAIYLSSKGKTGKELDENLLNATNLIANKKMLSRSKDILERLEYIIDEEEGIAKVKIISAEKLTKNIKDELEESLKKRYKAKEIYIEESEDKKMLGGMRIEKGDEVIDLTLRNKVRQLQEHLIRN